MREAKVWGIHDVRSTEDVGPTGCGYYRVVLPFDQLKVNGWEADYGPGTPPARALGASVMVAQRIDRADSLGLWRRMRTPKTALVYELDDDVWNVELLNWSAYQYYGKRDDVRDACEHAARVAQLVTVTCEPLAEVIRQQTGQTNVAVIPNFIPEAMLTHERPRRPNLTVGWGGGSSHANDIAEITQPIQRFMFEDAPKAVLNIVGTDFRPMLTRHHARHTPWEPNPWDYYKLLDFDIGLAPLAKLRFNESKSHIKCLEYAALGIPVIASDFGPYHDFVIDGVTGFLVRSKAQWRERLRELASDADLREAMGAKARELAAQHTIEGNWHRWDEAYRRLL